MTTNFNITKNVTDAFDLIVPDYIENTTSVARITGNINMSIIPSLITNLEIPLVLTSPELNITPTITTTGPTTYTYSTTAGDCHMFQGYPVSFGNFDIQLGFGEFDTTDGPYRFKTWIPFVVGTIENPIPKDTVINSATLGLVALSSHESGTFKIKIGCERMGNVVAPINYYDLDARIMTIEFNTDTVLTEWVTGTTYYWDVTTAVQEILNRADWESGNTLAVLCMDVSSKERYIYAASYENTTYTEPRLVINL